MELWQICEIVIVLLNLILFLNRQLHKTIENDRQSRRFLEAGLLVLCYVSYLIAIRLLQSDVPFVDKVIVLYLMMVGYMDLRYSSFSRFYICILMPLVFVDFYVAKMHQMQLADFIFLLCLCLVWAHGASIMGKGDVEFIFLITLSKGAPLSSLILLFSLCAAILVRLGMNLVLHRRLSRKQKMPFIPFLSMTYLIFSFI